MYTDARRNAQENDIQEGDLVLMKQKKTDKLSTNFNPNPMKIVSKGRNGVLVASPEGVQYRRNVTHLKKFIGEMPNSSIGDKSVKNQSEFVKGRSSSFHDVNVSNYEIMSNENVSMSYQCESNQNKSESSVCDSHYDALSNSLYESGKLQLSAKKPENVVHTRPVRERKMTVRFNDYELS